MPDNNDVIRGFSMSDPNAARTYDHLRGGKEDPRRKCLQASTTVGSGPSLVPSGVVPVAEWRPVVGYRPQATDMYAGLAMTGRRGRML